MGSLSISIFIVLLSLLVDTNGSHDATIEENARGREVTEAVLRRISSSNIFHEDHSFLARIAYTETKFGMKDETRNGGIWHVDEPLFADTKKDVEPYPSLHSKILKRFGIDWKQVKWSQLNIPLYSGLAAALYFQAIRHMEGIPDTIIGQANLWRNYYQPSGDIPKFVREAEELRLLTTCRGKMDLCIVLDSSGSINERDSRNYDRAKEFVAKLIESFTLDFTRIGMLIYSSEVETVFKLNNNLTIEEMARKARQAKYLNLGTRTDLAIQSAVRMFREIPVSKGVPRLVFVFTDGNTNVPDSDLPKSVNWIRIAGLIPISVGIGGDIKKSELEFIALNNSKHVFMLGNFVALQDFLYQITSVACETPQILSFGDEDDEEGAPVGVAKDNVIKNEKRLYEVSLPPEGITISLDTEEGETNGYWSYTERVPSAAIYDGVIDDGVFYIPFPKNANFNERRKREVSNDDDDDEGEADEMRRGSEPSAHVFISIEGIEESNNYTLTVETGNNAEMSCGGSLPTRKNEIESLLFCSAITPLLMYGMRDFYLA